MSSYEYKYGCRFLFVVWMVLTMLVPAGASAEEDSTPAGVFFEPIEVPLVNLDVSVFDRDGKPIPGLTADDFVVLEDGEPVQISHFSTSQAVSPQPGSAQPTQQDGGSSEDPAPAAATAEGRDQPLTLLVYVDESSLSSTRRQAMIEGLRGLFSQPLPGETQVMLVSYRDTIEIRQSLTDDPEQLLAALEGMEESTVTGFDAQRAPILRTFRSLINPTMSDSAASIRYRSSSVSTGTIESLMQDIERYAQQRAQRARQGFEALKGTIRSLSGLPGHKAVLYFTSGIELHPGEDMYALWERAFPTMARNYRSQADSKQQSLEPDLEAVIELANAYRVSFYTISNPDEALVSEGSAEFYGRESSTELENLPVSGQEVLSMMAAGTGGNTLTDNAKLADHLVELAGELSGSYTLGFRPATDETGGYHRVAVTLKRDGLEVRHREGYCIKSVEERMADRTLSATIHGVSDNPLGISVEASDSKPAADGGYTVPILVRVPIGKLALLPQESNHQGKVSVFVAAQDLSGRPSAVQHRQYPVDIPNSQLLNAISQEAGFAMALRLEAGKQVVAVGVRDELSNVEALVTLDVVVGDKSEQQL